MKKVPGKRVVEITTIQTGDLNGSTVTKNKVKREEVSQLRFEKLKQKYDLVPEVPEGAEIDSMVDLGQCYEDLSGGIRKIFGELELNQSKEKTVEKKSKKPATPKADTPATGDGQ